MRGAIVPLLISVIKFYLNTELYGNSVQLGSARKGAIFFVYIVGGSEKTEKSQKSVNLFVSVKKM